MLKTISSRMQEEHDPTEKGIEHLRCKNHPSNSLDAVLLNLETKQLSLICLQCIIDYNLECTKTIKINTVTEYIQNNSEKAIKNNQITSILKKELKESFFSYWSKDYVGEIEEQYNSFDGEITSLIETLVKVRNQFRDIANTEINSIRDRTEEIKRRLKAYVDKNMDRGSMNFTTKQELMNYVKSITSREQLERLCCFLMDTSTSDQNEQSHISEYEAAVQLINELRKTYEGKKTLDKETKKFKGNNLSEII